MEELKQTVQEVQELKEEGAELLKEAEYLTKMKELNNKLMKTEMECSEIVYKVFKEGTKEDVCEMLNKQIELYQELHKWLNDKTSHKDEENH